MAKVYISFLGTNDYVECIYKSAPEVPGAPVRFVQETTLSLFAGGAEATDRAFIFTTDDAYAKNWVDDGHWDREKNCAKKCEGLETRIKFMKLPFTVKRIRIPDGHSEEEIWEIFQIVYDALGEGDEVVFDITHAFRSIPMLAIVILNYARVLKNIRLRRIYYGAFEALGPSWKVEKIPVERRIAPLLDLISLDLLMQWAIAVDRFLGAGDAKAVKALALENVLPILKETRGKDKDAASVRRVANALDFFTSRMATCRGPELVHAANYLKKELENAGDTSFVKPLYPLFGHIQKQMADFRGEAIHDGIQAARWCLEHNLVQQGFTILDETLISYFVKRNGCDENDVKQREIASAAVGFARNNTPEAEWYGSSGKNKELARQYIELHKMEKALSNLLGTISQSRDNLNHAGYGKDCKRPEDYKTELEEILVEAQRLLSGR